MARRITAAVMVGVAAPSALADKVASADEVRALRAKLAKSPPKPDDYAAQPYPGAIFDAECSAGHTAPRLPDAAVYCFYTRDPIDKVRAWVKADGKPRSGVTVTTSEDPLAVNGLVKIDRVSWITYWTHQPTMAFHASFPADPPAAADLIAPLPPGAVYDRECSAARSLETKRNAKWRQVWCYTSSEPRQVVAKSFDTEYTSTSRRGVQVDLVEVSRTPAVTQIQYWLTTEPPRAAAADAAAPVQTAPKSDPPAPAPARTAAATPVAPGAASSSAPAPAPAPAAAPAEKALDAVRTLRGLFGR